MSTAVQLRNEAMERVELGTDPNWASEASTAVAVVAARREEFTTDEVWALLDRWGIERPREPRAMGPVMTAAVKNGLIRRAYAQPRPSVRPETHANPKTVYVG